MKKNVVFALSLVLLALSMLFLCGCKKEQSNNGSPLFFLSNGDGTCSLIGANSDATELEIPSQSPEGDIVTSVYASAFQNKTALKSITLPDTVKVIGTNAFLKCQNIFFGVF